MKWFGFIIIILVLSCSKPAEVANWKSIEKDLQTQFITTSDSALIELPAGHFMFTRGLLLDGKSSLTIRGAGIDKTILSFARQEEGAEGLKVSNMVDVTFEDFTIEDAKGDNVKVTDCKGVTFRRVKSQWTGGPREENGAYAFYPVLCKNVVIEACIAIGASDAGIYVGQSDSVIIRNNKAFQNVAGIESENSRWVEVYNNEAFQNTGGILIFDLPGLTQYGHTTRVYNNKVYENNFRNFAPEGNIVATVPPGTGLMLLATRNIEIFENEITNNRTTGIAIASYDLVEALATTEESQLNENIEMAQKDEDYDPYPNRLSIHDNKFRNKYWFPTTKNDFGLLFLTKFPFFTPDIVWDGIVPDRSAFQFCMSNNGKINFGDLDAANDFKNLNTNWSAFACEGVRLDPIF